VESTYGDRRHQAKPLIEQIHEPFLKTFERNGVVLIPSFAVGRAQTVTLMLRDLMNRGELPDVPIHIDSPMAVDATELYNRHLHNCNLDEELIQDGRSRLFPRKVHFHRSVKESKELNRLGGPRVIISASGMLAGGRVIHHLSQRLPDRKNLILMAGYQAAGTRGRALLEGAKSLKMHGQHIPVRAEFSQLQGLSAHADRLELMRWITSGSTMPEMVIVTHGEPKASAALAEQITAETGVPCVIPQLGDTFDFAARELSSAS
jgi:metallo-beta-lactamase family protein